MNPQFEQSKSWDCLTLKRYTSDKEAWTYAKVNEFKYLGVCLNTNNDCSREIRVWIMKTGIVSFALYKFVWLKIHILYYVQR